MKYHLRGNIKQGTYLIVLSCFCHKAGADGAAVIMCMLGTLMFFGKKEEEANDTEADEKLS